jgi:membrane associated rhomboid family serine protease
LNGADEPTCHSCGRPLPGPTARAGASIVRQVFGAELFMTRFFTGLCLVVFALGTLGSGGFPPIFGSYFAASELLRWGAIGFDLGRIEPWRYLAAVFVHLNLVHLALNMLSLVYLGRMLEQQVGGARLALLFVVTGIAGFIVSDLWHSYLGAPWITAGASGSLFGMMGAFIGWLYARRDPEWKNVLLRFAVYAVAFAFAFPVNNAAHLGGFVAGFPIGFLLQRERRPERRQRVFAILAAICVIASLASIVLSATSPIWKVRKAIELERDL